MLVTKWKNSSPKAKSVTVMLVILLSLTLCLMAFLPFFQTRAASEFSTPLTEMSFIEQLYQSNYIQYKYLKEKTDQKNWSYSDLYLTIDYLGNRESGDPAFSASSATYQIADRISSDASSDTPVSDGDLEEALYNVFLSQIDEMKAGAEKLTQYVDYCAQDTASGTQIGNSSVSELTALLNGQTSTEHPSYIYYAVIEYDAAGHVSSCRAYFGDESDSFLKKLETAGREQYFQQFSDDSDSLLLDFDSDSGQTYRYRVSLSGPSNMRIIYAITQQQYQKILSSRDLFMSDTNYDSLQYQSYCAAGVPHVLIGFFAAAFLFGGFMVLLFEKRGYCIRSFSICQLPIEIAAVLLCLFFQMTLFPDSSDLRRSARTALSEPDKACSFAAAFVRDAVSVFGDCFFPLLFRRLSSRHDCSRLPAQQTGVSRAQPDNPLLAQDYERLEPVLSGACQLRYRHRRQENDFQISHRQFYHPVCHYVFLGMGLCSTVDLLPDYLFPAQKIRL